MTCITQAPLKPPLWTNSPQGISLHLPPICKYCTYDLEFLDSASFPPSSPPSPTISTTSLHTHPSPPQHINHPSTPHPPPNNPSASSSPERTTPPPRPLPKWMSTLPSNRQKPTSRISPTPSRARGGSSSSFSESSSSATPKQMEVSARENGVLALGLEGLG